MRISDHPSSTRVPRRRAGSAAGRVLLITVAVLAVLAAVLMVLADQARWLRFGVVAALWAALAGAFAAARYRRELLGHTDRADELQRVYELELEREVSARREYELEMETSTRRQVEQEVRNEVRGELDGLRAEVRTLRMNLQTLLGGEAPPNAERSDTGQRPTSAPTAVPTAVPTSVPTAQAGNLTEVLPRYRQGGSSSSEPAAFRDHRQPPAAQEQPTQEHGTGRWQTPRDEPPQLPASQHRAPEPAAGPALERFDSWVSANQAQPENDGPGGRRRRPDDTGPSPLTDLTAGRRHAADGKPASNGIGRRGTPDIQANDDPGGTSEPRRRHRREA